MEPFKIIDSKRPSLSLGWRVHNFWQREEEKTENPETAHLIFQTS
jgi:hypothetical protein